MPATPPKPPAKSGAKSPAKPAARLAVVKTKAAPPAKGPGKSKPDAAPKATAPKVVPATAAKADALRLKDLVAAVVEATDMKKPDAKRAVEATLASLAAALKRGHDLNLPPLGRARVAKTSEKDGAATLTLKLRLGGGSGQGAKQPLAADGEDD
ncbi:HU family DNA-binding protein [Tabrizicola sp. BL-A-41-H6]|uniref:HU family DNA-binding protein n=1 Tax=Tabrizicola sp. BL-A-41-H6 TaxID=3421107 RepID=UPI003D67CE81